MSNAAEESVTQYYEQVGWKMEGEVEADVLQWENLRASAQAYISRCRMRVYDQIPEEGDLILDIGCGTIQYPEYQAYSKNFNKRYCVDVSSSGLEQAQKRLGDHGVYINNSLLDLDFSDNMFDCSISLHAIYHIQESLQELAIRNMIRMTKPGKPVIIVYQNMATLINRLFKPKERFTNSQLDFYMYAHQAPWWSRFEDVAQVKLLSWRAFTARQEKLLFPDNALGKKMFDVLFRLEETFPRFFVHLFKYPMIVMTKNE